MVFIHASIMNNVVNIVPPDTIFDNQQVLEEHYVLMNLNFPSAFDAMQWLAQRRLIRNSLRCHQCNIAMTLRVRADRIDGHQWYCGGCKKRASVRNNSFFARSHLSLQTLIIIIYCWAYDFSQTSIKREADLGEEATHTVIDWCSFCRDVCQEYLDHYSGPIGGIDEHDFTSKIVEVDESKFGRRKYRGRWRQGHWVFGGVERGSGKCFLVKVEDRSAETLNDIIRRRILPGSLIMSDGWRAYQDLDQLDGGIYEHSTIIHQQNFVDPVDNSVHTKNVENMWMRAKEKLKRQHGTSEALFPTYLYEFMWRNMFKTKQFQNFLVCVTYVHPV